MAKTCSQSGSGRVSITSTTVFVILVVVGLSIFSFSLTNTSGLAKSTIQSSVIMQQTKQGGDFSLAETAPREDGTHDQQELFHVEKQSEQIITQTKERDPSPTQAIAPVQTQTSFSLRYSLENYNLPYSYNLTRQGPTEEIPFILFHQRKAGGTTMRSEVYKAADTLNLTAYMPCFTRLTRETKGPIGVSCETYFTPHLRSEEPSMVYGGHFYYSTFVRTLFLHHGNIEHKSASMEPPTPKYTCMTTFREPLSRIQSCWNYRMVQEGGALTAPTLDKMTAAAMQVNLPKARSQFGEGCLNEPFRMFSDVGTNEDTVNHLHEQPSAMVEYVMNQTITRASKCIVGILERCEDTRKAIKRHLPWLSPYFHCRDHFKRGRIRKQGFNDKQSAVMKDLSKYETQIYELANKLLDAQMKD